MSETPASNRSGFDSLHSLSGACPGRMICALVVLLLAYLIPGAVRCDASSAVSRKAALILQWSFQAQSAGFLVAQDRGFYRDRGIALTILNGGPRKPSPRFLEEGKATFSVMPLSTAMKHCASGNRFINIGQVLQKSGLMFIARKSSGIKEPADMMHRTVGLWDGNSRIEAELFLRMHRLQVKVIPQSFTVNLFLFNGLDVASATSYNEFHTIIDSGYDSDELVTLFFSDYGLDFPQDGIYVLDRTYRGDREMCRAFTEASMRGWEYSFAHPDEALDTVMKYMEQEHIPASRVHQKWMLDSIRNLVAPDGISELSGWLSKDCYDKLAGLMKDCGMIRTVPPFSDFYKGVRKDR